MVTRRLAFDAQGPGADEPVVEASLSRDRVSLRSLDGKSYPLDGPRRIMYYTPEKSPISNVISGACYALHIKGNPEVIIAIENSGDPTRPNTYIEVSRLSGGEINVYRKGWRTIEFPARAEVRGAYVGMSVER